MQRSGLPQTQSRPAEPVMTTTLIVELLSVISENEVCENNKCTNHAIFQSNQMDLVTSALIHRLRLKSLLIDIHQHLVVCFCRIFGFKFSSCFLTHLSKCCWMRKCPLNLSELDLPNRRVENAALFDHARSSEA